MPKTSSKTQTKTAVDIANIAQKMGDKLHDQFNTTDDLKVATLAIKSYSTSLRAHKDRLLYKRLTGVPATIPFYEK